MSPNTRPTKSPNLFTKAPLIPLASPVNGAPKGPPHGLWEFSSAADRLAALPAPPVIASPTKGPPLSAAVSPTQPSPMDLDLPAAAAPLEENMTLALALKQKQTKAILLLELLLLLLPTQLLLQGLPTFEVHGYFWRTAISRSLIHSHHNIWSGSVTPKYYFSKHDGDDSKCFHDIVCSSLPSAFKLVFPDSTWRDGSLEQFTTLGSWEISSANTTSAASEMSETQQLFNVNSILGSPCDNIQHLHG